MSTAFDICREAGIRLKSYSTGEHRTVCPKCSHLRKAIHRRTECLAVNIDFKGVRWQCHHCDEHGGKFFNQGTEDRHTYARQSSARSLYR